MVWILKDLRQRSQGLEPIAQAVRLLDCAPFHTHPRAAHAAARKHAVSVSLAASMASSLPPLDVFVFTALKQ